PTPRTPGGDGLSDSDRTPRPEGPSPGSTIPTPYAGAGQRKLARRDSSLRRRWVLYGVIGVVTLALVGGGGWLPYLNNMLDNVDQVSVTVDESNRPPPTHGEERNILLAGADNGPGPSIAAS